MTNLVVDLNHETESVPLKFIFVVERLNDFERTRSVIIAHHGEFVSTKSAALNDLLVFGIMSSKESSNLVNSPIQLSVKEQFETHLVMKCVGLVFIINGDCQNRSVR